MIDVENETLNLFGFESVLPVFNGFLSLVILVLHVLHFLGNIIISFVCVQCLLMVGYPSSSCWHDLQGICLYPFSIVYNFVKETTTFLCICLLKSIKWSVILVLHVDMTSGEYAYTPLLWYKLSVEKQRLSFEFISCLWWVMLVHHVDMTSREYAYTALLLYKLSWEKQSLSFVFISLSPLNVCLWSVIPILHVDMTSRKYAYTPLLLYKLSWKK